MLRLRERTTRDQRRPRSRRASVEFLESRTLLAGNVVTTPTGTPDSPGQPAPGLDIQGDALANEILIKKGDTPDEIIVSGLNGTLVNGSTQEWHYQGVRQLFARMDAGDDDIKLTDLKLSSTPGGVGDPFEGIALFDVQIDGGVGDDRINVSNTTFNAKAPADPTTASSVSMLLIGDLTDATTGATTGNDWIDVNDTTLIADGGQVSVGALQIFGDFNSGGTITGGNDHINVSDTVIRATSSSFEGVAQAFVRVFGDANQGQGNTSVIGEGSDWIDVNRTSIIADSAQGSGAIIFQVYGDFNFADGGGTATIGNLGTKAGGNDTISLTNTTVSASGANFSANTVAMDVRGDQNFSDVDVADIGGGNDTISITNFAASASGVTSTNTTDLTVFGDGDVTGDFDVTSRIGGGNDLISMTNDDIFAAGNPNNAATVLFYSDDVTQQGETGTTVGQGDDNVNIFNFLLDASNSSNIQLHTQKGNDVVDIHNIRTGGLLTSYGSGNDDVSVLNSVWSSGQFRMEQGNDLLKMNGNSFVLTSADGGLGIDTLAAHNNTGVLVPTNFEIFQ